MMMSEIQDYLEQHYDIPANQWAEDGYGYTSWSYVIGYNGKVAFRENAKGHMEVCHKNQVYILNSVNELPQYME